MLSFIFHVRMMYRLFLSYPGVDRFYYSKKHMVFGNCCGQGISQRGKIYSNLKNTLKNGSTYGYERQICYIEDT